MKRVLLKRRVLITVMAFVLYLSGTIVDASTETVRIYAGSGDGYTMGRNYTNDWNELHDRSTSIGQGIDTEGAFYTGENDIHVQTSRYYKFGRWSYVAVRPFIPFDTTILPEDAVITGATLNLYPATWRDGSTNVYVVQSTQASVDLVLADDFDQAGAVDDPEEGGVVRNDVPYGQYASIPLNETGLSWIKKDGWTKLALRTSDDAHDDVPSRNNGIAFRSSESEGVNVDPYLEITYTTGEESNTYPLYTQIESPYPGLVETASWADDVLAGGSAGRGCETIAKCGCTITSLVMLGRSYGITTGINGSDVNPGNFNAWLVENGGYNPAGLLDFSQAVKYFGVEENGVQKTYLKWNEKRLSGDEVKQRVESGVPVVSSMVARNRNGTEIPTHFVLVTELLDGGKYGVNDPIWYNTKDLNDDAMRESWVQDYNDRISNGRSITYVEDPVAVTSTLSMSLVGRGVAPLAAGRYVQTSAMLASDSHSPKTAPAEMYVVTPAGQKLGYDPTTDEVFELEDGEYWNESLLTDPLAEDYVAPIDVVKSLALTEAEGGTYLVYVVGTGTGEYEYSGLVHDPAGQAHEFNFSAETVEGMVDVYALNLETGEAVLLPMSIQTFEEIIDAVVGDEIQNKFFKMWAQKIFAEIEVGKTDQAVQHIETVRTLMQAKKINSPALELLLERLEGQLQ